MKEMEFTHGDRRFTCRAEGSAATPGTLWWWVNVTGELSRYAVFRAEAADTARSLRPRIIAYYEEMLAIRSRPPAPRSHWSQKRNAQPAVNATDEAGAGSTVEPPDA